MSDILRYSDRRQAGKLLARELMEYAGSPNLIVLALPRGGVPVAFEIVRELNAPLDVFLVRKLGLPEHPDLAMGAIADGGIRILNENVIARAGISEKELGEVEAREEKELRRRAVDYRQSRPFPSLQGKTVILVDDGIATGATLFAALTALRRQAPAKLIVAAPVGSREACDSLREIADRVVCPLTPPSFRSVGQWYDDFEQTSDAEVRSLLAESAHAASF
jgi:putative phosphoribosyl transferase